MKRRGSFASPLARFKEDACFLPHAWLPQAAFSPTSAPSTDRPLLSHFLFPRLPLTQQGVVVKFSHQPLPWYPILERDQAEFSCPLVTSVLRVEDVGEEFAQISRKPGLFVRRDRAFSSSHYNSRSHLSPSCSLARPQQWKSAAFSQTKPLANDCHFLVMPNKLHVRLFSKKTPLFSRLTSCV